MALKKHFPLALLLALVCFACSKEKDPAVDPTVNPVEISYTATGPQSVSSTVVRNGAGADLYKIYYPSVLNSTYPVVVWGNGSGQKPDDYARTMRHLASWGYVVIDNYDSSTGTGASIVAAAQYIEAQSRIPSSIFYGKVDVNRIGAVGHSQGAVGVVNAHTTAGGGRLIKTIVPIAIPRDGSGNLDYDAEEVNIPVFFIGGSDDNLLAPPAASKTAYDKIPDRVPAVIGIRVSAGHDAIKDNERLWGYLTAWLQFQLKGDTDAAKAFAGSSAEIVANPKWEDVATKSLP